MRPENAGKGSRTQSLPVRVLSIGSRVVSWTSEEHWKPPFTFPASFNGRSGVD
jgi:hypothetical protein